MKQIGRRLQDGRVETSGNSFCQLQMLVEKKKKLNSVGFSL